MATTVREHLNEMSEEELHGMVRREYLRKLARYRKTDELYRNKYGMTFEEFESQNIVAERGYTWEVESDAQEWETAVDGIKTMLTKLREIGVEAV